MTAAGGRRATDALHQASNGTTGSLVRSDKISGQDRWRVVGGGGPLGGGQIGGKRQPRRDIKEYTWKIR